MSQSNDTTPEAFAALIQDIRPELHRYSARMIGSVVDAEDVVVQEALTKAYVALPATEVANMRGWLFRIVHNKAIDHLRRADGQRLEHLDEQALLAEPDPPLEEGALVSLALSVFLKLPPKQRSCVILKDVIGYSLAEISELLDATVPEIKAALHRGRTRLRELAQNLDANTPAPSDEHERELLRRYVERFNARDFDSLRALLTDEVRLELFNRASRRGHVEVGEYFHRYDQSHDWQLALGAVEHRPAILVYNPHAPSAPPTYFMLIEWEGGQISLIRDYRYTPYVMRDAVVQKRALGDAGSPRDLLGGDAGGAAFFDDLRTVPSCSWAMRAVNTLTATVPPSPTIALQICRNLNRVYSILSRNYGKFVICNGSELLIDYGHAY
jgi:RNA polymerase sigma-70 factor (ECF subfamily)